MSNFGIYNFLKPSYNPNSNQFRPPFVYNPLVNETKAKYDEREMRQFIEKDMRIMVPNKRENLLYRTDKPNCKPKFKTLLYEYKKPKTILI